MPLKAVVKVLDDVDEGVRPLYKQEGDHFVLDVEPVNGYALENVEGLKTTVGKLRRENTDHLGALKRYEGLDPDEARTAITKVAEFANIDPAKEADRIAGIKVREAVDQLKGHHSKEVNTLAKRLDTYKGRLVGYGVDGQIDAALTALEQQGHKLIPGARDDLKLILGRYVKHTFDEDTGGVRVAVHDGDDIPKIKSNGDPMTIADFVAELPTKRANFFEPKDTGGSGARGAGGGGGGGGGGAGLKRSQMSPQEKSKYISEHGLPKYQALPL